MRFKKKIKCTLTEDLKLKLLQWARNYREVIWLDSNLHSREHSKYQAILAVDAFTSIQTDYHDAFNTLNEYQTLTQDWLFGYLTYDLKNDVERLYSKNHDGLDFPDLYFFQPKKIFLFSEEEIEICYLHFVADELDTDWQEILDQTLPETNDFSEEKSPIKIRLRTSKDSYFRKVDQVLQHINRGDIYEANFCQEFYSENVQLDPIGTYNHLNEISMPPFATFLKVDKKYALCASPERYLQRNGDVIITQPIKGTAKRSQDPREDLELRAFLENDPKERSENIMITDLVRNDLSKIAKKGSVQVDELCKIYSFEQVHQMISTVRCEIADEVSSVEVLRATFPMGSMTGAPKIRAMEIIEDLEDCKRGLYSGAIGYFDPNNDFDFNVIIRSILYDANTAYVSYSVGGAITAGSVPENEYEECLLKAKAMREALEK